MQHLYFMRHGETPYNRSGRVQGRTDIPLNEDGVTEAGIARDFFMGKGISFDLVMSSPLHRAVATAAIIGQIPEEKVIQDERVIELDFGTSEGSTVNDLPQGVLNLFYEPEKYQIPEGGESIEELQARCSDFLQEMAQKLAADPKLQTVLVISHGAALRGFISCIEHTQRKDFWAGNLENCCVYQTGFDGKDFHTIGYLHPLEGTQYMIPPWKRDEILSQRERGARTQADDSPAAGTEGGPDR